MKNICVYCTKRRAGSEEHIFATWLVEMISRDPRGFPAPTLLKIGLRDGRTREIKGKMRKGKPTIEFTTRRVCHTCNNEWMNRVDERARPIIEPMIQGSNVVLDRKAQEALAAWACKTAVSARYVLDDPVRKEWTDHLHNNESAIPGWYIWIGWYEGRLPFSASLHDVSVVPVDAPGGKPGDTPIAEHGVGMTLVVGYLVVQLLAVDGMTGHHDIGYIPLLPIWPSSGLGLIWPPAHHFDDESLPVLESRVGGVRPPRG